MIKVSVGLNSAKDKANVGLNSLKSDLEWLRPVLTPTCAEIDLSMIKVNMDLNSIRDWL